MPIQSTKGKIIAIILLIALAGGALFLLIRAQQGSPDDLKVYFLDFSNEDAILLQHRGKAILIDTAEAKHAEELLLRLRYFGVEKLDILILTHPDKDHIGGAPAVLSEFPVDMIVQSPYVKESKEENALRQSYAQLGVTPVVPEDLLHIDWSGLSLDIYPAQEAAKAGSNDSSLVTVLQHGENRLVFAGDAAAQRLQELLKTPVFPCTLYKVPHHGRDNERSAEVIEKLRPAYAIITARAAEPLVFAALERTGSDIFYTTGRCVQAISNGRRMTVSYLELD